MPLPNKNLLDVSQVFLAYASFFGDAVKTAYALDIPVETVKDLARSENWDSKLKEVSKGGDNKDVQVQINRAVNYIQAHRARSVLDKFLTELVKLDGKELIAALTVTTKHGSEVKTRALTDLVKAIETTQLMTARALGDTAEERPKETEGSGGSQIALDVIKAMSAADEIGLDSVSAVKRQLAEENRPNA